MPSRRVLLATVGGTVLPTSGCVGGAGTGSGDDSSPADSDSKTDSEQGDDPQFSPYTVTVSAARGGGDLAIQAEVTDQPTAVHPAIISLTVENQADEPRRYASTFNQSVPFNGRGLQHINAKGWAYLRSIDGDDPAGDSGFERHGTCWHYGIMADKTAALEYEAGAVTTYQLGIAGRSLDPAADEQDGERCIPAGVHVGTERLREYDAWVTRDYDEDAHLLGEIELRLELLIERE